MRLNLHRQSLMALRIAAMIPASRSGRNPHDATRAHKELKPSIHLPAVAPPSTGTSIPVTPSLASDAR